MPHATAITKLSKKEIKSLVREGVKEALGTEFMKLRSALVPFVSDAEQKDIEKRYRKPSRKTAKSYTVRI